MARVQLGLGGRRGLIGRSRCPTRRCTGRSPRASAQNTKAHGGPGRRCIIDVAVQGFAGERQNVSQTQDIVTSSTFSTTFHADWGGIMSRYLTLCGSPTAELSEPWDLTAAVLNLERFWLPRMPRAVFRAKGLPEITSLTTFLTLVEAGEDLSPYQSRLYQPSFNDLLLNDLGIRHFHMTEPAAPRVDQLLFAIVQAKVFYAVAVQGHSAFKAEALVEEVHVNWPELLAEFIPPNVVPGSHKGPSISKRAAFRKVGLMTAIQVSDGTIYLPPGGGVTTGGLGGHRGLSVVVVIDANKAMTYITNLERATLDAAERIAAMIDESDKHLTLACRGNILWGVSQSGQTAIRLGESPIRLRIEDDRWLTSR